MLINRERIFLLRMASGDFKRESREPCHSRMSESRQKVRLQSRSESTLAKKTKKVYLSNPHYCHLSLSTTWRGEGRKE